MTDKLLFTCRVCGCDVGTHGFTVDASGEEVAQQGVCEAHCEDHDYEYDRDRRGKFCVHCDAEHGYEPSDDDVGFGSYYEPREPVGIPASAMDGNASTRHRHPEKWDNWVQFCDSWGHP